MGENKNFSSFSEKIIAKAGVDSGGHASKGDDSNEDDEDYKDGYDDSGRRLHPDDEEGHR